MAIHDPTEARKLYLKIGDGGSPEAFSFLCSVTSLTRTISNEFAEAKVNDCADPTANPTTVRALIASNHTLSVSGTYSTQEKSLIDKARSGARNNYQLWFAETLADGGEYEGFAAFVQNFSVSRAEGGFVNFTADILIEGAPTVTAVS